MLLGVLFGTDGPSGLWEPPLRGITYQIPESQKIANLNSPSMNNHKKRHFRPSSKDVGFNFDSALEVDMRYLHMH